MAGVVERSPPSKWRLRRYGTEKSKKPANPPCGKDALDIPNA
ncbi:hypothetical protein ABEH28_00125 [Pseudomonas sp. Ps21-P2]